MIVKSEFEPEKVLVLGANSFAGATFISQLQSLNLEVLGISRSQLSELSLLIIGDCSNFKFIQLDINSAMTKLIDLLDNFQPTFIVDFAGQGMVAESWSNPLQWYTTNLLSKIKILEHLKNKTWLKKYIRISTPEVYGSSNVSVTEQSKISPSTPYAVSHAAIDMNLRIYFDRYNFPGIIGRFANFYGPGQQLFRIVPRTILSVLSNTKIPLHGGGLSERSFIFSDDFSSGILLLLSKGEIGETYHFSNNQVITIFQLVENICSQMGVNVRDHILQTEDRPSKDFRYLMDSSKASKFLGWTSDTNLESGISQTIQWYRNNYGRIASVPLEYIHKP